MRRRTVIGMLGASALPFTWPRRARGQPKTRAAVVIGVDKCRGLPNLKAAVAGAREFSRWLKQEGFVVKEFLDDKGPVTAEPIYDAVEELLDLGTLEQLLVYFSGHGFLVSNSEHWLLSKGPANPNQSVLQPECVVLARRCGVPHVVFISDACRSTTDSLGAQSMRGQVIFPAADQILPVRVRVDQFFAAGPGAYALELPVQKSADVYEGIYTSAFLNAFKSPDKSMVRVADGFEVVPNRLLDDYLIRETQLRAQRHSITLRQKPDSYIESEVPAYIGRVRPMASTGPEIPYPDPPRPVATLSDVAALSLTRAGLEDMRLHAATSADSQVQLERLASESGFSATRSVVLMASPPMGTVTQPAASVPRPFETDTRVVVLGARVTNVVLERPFAPLNPPVQGNGTSQSAIVRLGPEPTSVAIRFADSSGTVIAAIPGYIATVVVRDGRVLDVSYVPSESGPFSYDGPTMERLSVLRASVAASAQFGVFRIKGDPKQRETLAAKLADQIRTLKGVDPALGLYAAHAYADVGLADRVRSVRDSMRSQHGFDLFDVAMLDVALSALRWPDERLAYPVCPMLTQGWSLLRVSDTRLLPDLERARGYLKQSLWTTFDPAGMSIIEQLIRKVGR